MKKHGGIREGAGRPVLPDNQKKVAMNVRLPLYIKLWLDEQDSSTSELIEQALINTYSIS